MKSLQVGASGHYGVRSAKTVGYDYPAFTTQEGFAFWKPTYTDSAGNLVHILPSSTQVTVAGELYWPVSIIDLTTEVVYADHDTREALDGYQTAYPFTERYGAMKGLSYYTELAVWVVGDRQYVRRPGYVDPPHIDFAAPLPPTRNSIELLAKFEQLRMVYSSASARGGRRTRSRPAVTSTRTSCRSAPTSGQRGACACRSTTTSTFSPGASRSALRRRGAPTQSSSQRANAPAQLLSASTDASARESAHTLNELTARVAVGF